MRSVRAGGTGGLPMPGTKRCARLVSALRVLLWAAAGGGTYECFAMLGAVPAGGDEAFAGGATSPLLGMPASGVNRCAVMAPDMALSLLPPLPSRSSLRPAAGGA